MIVELNGRPHELPDDTTLGGLIEAVTGATRGSAAAVDGVVVPRGDWPGFRLRSGHVIEVITAVQGG
jgi:sulfur carrier protein